MRKAYTLMTAVATILVISTAALAQPGVTTSAVNMRSGPGTQHMVVGAIPASQPLTIIGCLSGGAWCDVVWAGRRGWVSANYVYYTAPGYSVPVTTVYHRVPTVSPWVDARRDARVQYRVHRRMDRRWDRWTGE